MLILSEMKLVKKNSGGIAEKWTIHVGEFPVNQLFIYHMGK